MSRSYYKYDIRIDGICGPDDHVIIYKMYGSCSDYVEFCYPDGSDVTIWDGDEYNVELLGKVILDIDDDHITKESVWVQDLPDKLKELWKLNTEIK